MSPEANSYLPPRGRQPEGVLRTGPLAVGRARDPADVRRLVGALRLRGGAGCPRRAAATPARQRGWGASRSPTTT